MFLGITVHVCTVDGGLHKLCNCVSVVKEVSVAKGCHRIRPVCSKCPWCICKDYGSQLVCRKMLCSKILASFVDTTS